MLRKMYFRIFSYILVNHFCNRIKSFFYINKCYYKQKYHFIGNSMLKRRKEITETFNSYQINTVENVYHLSHIESRISRLIIGIQSEK